MTGTVFYSILQLLNESGLSNSSMQQKGYCLMHFDAYVELTFVFAYSDLYFHGISNVCAFRE